MPHRSAALLFLILLPGLASAQSENLWQADTFQAVNGNYSAWCGSFRVESCSSGDQDGGYGRNYDEILEWRGTVDNPGQACTVSVTAVINIDTMDGYDFFYINCRTADSERINLLFVDGLEMGLPISCEFVYQPEDFVGVNGDGVVLEFRVTSDGGWDGEDCLWPNDGAVQLDDLVINLSNGIGYSHDFEDGTLGELIDPSALVDVPDLKNFSVAAYPNPFNPSTVISYNVGHPGHLTLKIFDLRGRLVARLVDGPVITSGSVTWDGTNIQGATIPSGVYFYQARLGDEEAEGKLTLVK
jgi:hypothetical protein